MPPDSSISRDEFERRFNVSRETMQNLDDYRDNLERWAKRINLVSLTTLQDFWCRHALDSAQLIGIAGNNARRWIDFGSGAGFPGLIVAALLAQNNQGYSVTLVDTNIKRCAFLAESARILGVNVNILNKKADTIAPFELDIITARAFTGLKNLLDLSLPFATIGARPLFLKGETVHDEIKEASTNYSFGFKTWPSLVHPKGQVIEITNLSRIEKNV